MNWLEVSLTVNGELAEAVAEVLARFAPNGVTTEQGVEFFDDEDPGRASGPITVRAYLPADARLEERRSKLEEALYYLGRIQPLPEPKYNPIADQNWMESWKQHYQPIPIGKRLMIIPAWMDSSDPQRVAIKIDPGMAFGTGTHPTTQLSLELIETQALKVSEIFSDWAVIDIGCGSGILSIAALKLGAQTALGVDIDPESVKNSRQNADANGIGEELMLGVGSVKEVLDGEFAIQRAPLVIANILAPVIIQLFGDGLADLLEPDGVLVLSGILQGQIESVVAAAKARGLKLSESRQMEDWVALTMTR